MRSVCKRAYRGSVIFWEGQSNLWEGSFHRIGEAGTRHENNTAPLPCTRPCCGYPTCFLVFSAHSLPEGSVLMPILQMRKLRLLSKVT